MRALSALPQMTGLKTTPPFGGFVSPVGATRWVALLFLTRQSVVNLHPLLRRRGMIIFPEDIRLPNLSS